MKKTLTVLQVFVAIVLTTGVISSCSSRNGKGQKAVNQVKSFPFPEVPMMMTDPADISKYVTTVFWDTFFKEPQSYFDEKQFQAAFAQYAQMLISVPPAIIEQAQDSLLDKAERSQQQWPEGNLLSKVLTLEEQFFYDPNSPLRNEECCLPYLRKIVSTTARDEAARQKAEYEIPLFSLNRLGQPAENFTYTLKNGRKGTLFAVKAKFILLFFSNPGCHNCKEIIDALSTDPKVQEMIGEGSLKVLNIYPDADLTEWYNYMSHYPETWINGYDAENILHANTIYNIRAIPSIYLLDENKKVLCKDAPLEVALNYLYR